jgi:hypothetical protein
MKICAEGSQSEYTACGNSFDIIQTENDDDLEPFRFAKMGERVTCKDCQRVIRYYRVNFTIGFKYR